MEYFLIVTLPTMLFSFSNMTLGSYELFKVRIFVGKINTRVSGKAKGGVA